MAEGGGFNRISSFMATKRPGFFVGRVSPEDLAVLIEIIKAAKASNQSVVFFMGENKPGSKFVASLMVAVDKPKEGTGPDANVRRRPIGGSGGGFGGGGTGASNDPTGPRPASAFAGIFGNAKKVGPDEGENDPNEADF